MHETAKSDVDRLEIGAPHRELLDQVLDKWSLQVLEELCECPLRFNGIRRAIPAVTQKSLTATLRKLERNGIVERVVVQQRPMVLEYRITALGKTLREPVDALQLWTRRNMPAVEQARRTFDADS